MDMTRRSVDTIPQPEAPRIHFEVKEPPKPPKEYPSFHGDVSYLLQIDRMERESMNKTVYSAAAAVQTAPEQPDFDWYKNRYPTIGDEQASINVEPEPSLGR